MLKLRLASNEEEGRPVVHEPQVRGVRVVENSDEGDSVGGAALECFVLLQLRVDDVEARSALADSRRLVAWSLSGLPRTPGPSTDLGILSQPRMLTFRGVGVL